MSENVYRSPEKFGLKILEESDIGAGYEFNRFVVFSDLETGELFCAQDSGCSCPSPFEDLVSRDDLTRIGPESIEYFEQQAQRYFSGEEEYSIRLRVRLQRAAQKAVKGKAATWQD